MINLSVNSNVCGVAKKNQYAGTIRGSLKWLGIIVGSWVFWFRSI